MLRPLLTLVARKSSSPYSQSLSRASQQLRPIQTAPPNMQRPPAKIKPPNVLIFQPSKDSTAVEFLRAREALEDCLTPERYAIYALSYDEIVHKAPWMDNCRLVVVPPHPGGGEGSLDAISQLSPKVLKELVSYLGSGGALLSLNDSLNRYLGLRVCTNEQSLDVTISLEEKGTLSPDSGVGGVNEAVTFHALNVQSCDSHMIKEDRTSKAVITSREPLASFEPSFDANTNQSNNIPDSAHLHDHTHWPAAELLSVEGGGRAIVCGVDLLPLAEGKSDMPLLVKLKKDVVVRSKVMSRLLSMLSLECSEERMPELTPTYLVCGQEAYFEFISACAPFAKKRLITGREMSLRLIEHDFEAGSPVDPAPSPAHSEMTLITRPAKWQLSNQPFDFVEYIDNLRTSCLGHTLLYTAVITSTQSLFTGNFDLCNALTADMGVVSVAGQQTRGKGRSGNVWLSPKGSMMFSTVLKLPPTSRLGQRMTLLQHLVAMAVVHGIRSTPGYQDLQIRIKWPNDIYYQDQVKLGGVLVTSFAIPSSKDHTAIVGCGVNIDNKHPTMSVNDCIAVHNATTHSSLSPLSVEYCLAATLTSLEGLLTVYESSGLEGLEELYYKYWLHGGSVVRLANYGDMEAVITGIDDYGYLLVRSRKDGQQLSLQPDGNSFDIMKGLIAMKSHS